jgi:hypothetical protein
MVGGGEITLFGIINVEFVVYSKTILVIFVRDNREVRASNCHCRSPGFDNSFLRHSGIRVAADEAVLNKVHRKKSYILGSFYNFTLN